MAITLSYWEYNYSIYQNYSVKIQVPSNEILITTFMTTFMTTLYDLVINQNQTNKILVSITVYIQNSAIFLINLSIQKFDQLIYNNWSKVCQNDSPLEQKNMDHKVNSECHYFNNLFNYDGSYDIFVLIMISKYLQLIDHNTVLVSLSALVPNSRDL